MKKTFQYANERGFTLMEMLAVIAIIGILSAIAFPSLSGAREKARDSERVTEIGEIALALEMHYNSCRRYPNAVAGVPNINADTGCPSGVTFATFLPTLPVDPINDATYRYQYASPSPNTSFVIQARLERDNSALGNDVDGTVLGLNCADSPNFYYCKKG